jgi:hypothetical protein
MSRSGGQRQPPLGLRCTSAGRLVRSLGFKWGIGIRAGAAGVVALRRRIEKILRFRSGRLPPRGRRSGRGSASGLGAGLLGARDPRTGNRKGQYRGEHEHLGGLHGVSFRGERLLSQADPTNENAVGASGQRTRDSLALLMMMWWPRRGFFCRGRARRHRTVVIIVLHNLFCGGAAVEGRIACPTGFFRGRLRRGARRSDRVHHSGGRLGAGWSGACDPRTGNRKREYRGEHQYLRGFHDASLGDEESIGGS